MRQTFQDQLSAVYHALLEMGGLAEEAIRLSVESLASQDIDKATQVIDGDDRIDQLELDIEQGCVKLLALQQPMAGDLRLITTIMKVVTDIERLADYATNIAETTHRLEGQRLIKPLVDIPRMAEMSQSMVRASLDAFVRRDVPRAYEICFQDDDVDEMYERLHDELQHLAAASDDPATVNQCLHLLFVSSHLERIADHATNIAERVVYVVEGKRYKAQTRRPPFTERIREA